MVLQKALFLDRDGIINEDTAYPFKPEHIRFVDGIFDVCRKAIEKGYILIVITNQAGVAKGIFTEEDVENLHTWMTSKFKEQGIKISAFYYCPFHPEAKIEKYRKNSDCRKPEPGLVLKAVKDFGIDLSVSLMVGDKKSDRIKIPELKSVIVKSKYVPSDYDVESLQKITSFL